MTLVSQLLAGVSWGPCHNCTINQVLSKAAVRGTGSAYYMCMNATQTVKKTLAALAILLVLVSGNAAQIKTTTGRREAATIVAIA